MLLLSILCKYTAKSKNFLNILKRRLLKLFNGTFNAQIFLSMISNGTNVSGLYVVCVDGMVEWLKRRYCDRHDFGLKSIRVILLYPWKRPFTAFSPAWRSWQAVFNFSHNSIKLKN